MAKEQVGKVLFSLADTDKEIQQLSEQSREIESTRASLFSELSKAKERLQEVEGAHKEAVSRQSLEEHRLKEEEAKIVERRKQLTALGGAKSAKLVERELDIATRVMETLERTAVEAMQSTEGIAVELESLKQRVEALELQFENETSSAEETLSSAKKKLKELESERETLLKKVDDRLKNLYVRVNSRYPGEGVSAAKGGACRSCFRALPAQLWNQIMAGNNLIQCPGCSRILVFSE